MSIQSEINRIRQGVSEQSSLINQIKSALEGKAGGGGGNTEFPDGFKRADYIQFSGKQVVDTGIICNQNTKIKTQFTRESSAQEYFFGVASSDNKKSVTAYLGGSWRFGDKSSTKTVSTQRADIGYGAVVSNTEISVTHGVTAISGVNNFETVGTLLIGSCRGSNGVAGAPQFDGKVFYFAMWEGEEQVLKLVPVTDGKGTFRFYDEVSKTFFDSTSDYPLEGGVI